MPISVGDKLPDTTFFVMGENGPEGRTVDDVFAGKKIVLFGVPGAYTGTCSNTHVPGYLVADAEIRAKGVDDVAVVAVNDPFVMKAWAESTGGQGVIQFLADGNGAFAKAIDLEMDGSGAGLGTRNKRFSMIVEDGVVTALNVEDVPSVVTVTGADQMLEQL